jgi:hypothetical protein
MDDPSSAMLRIALRDEACGLLRHSEKPTLGVTQIASCAHSCRGAVERFDALLLMGGAQPKLLAASPTPLASA